MNSHRRLCLFLSSVLVISQFLASMHVSVHASESARSIHSRSIHSGVSHFGGFNTSAGHQEHAGHEHATPEQTEEVLSCLNYHMLLATPGCLSGYAMLPGCTWFNQQKFESPALSVFFNSSWVPAIRGPPAFS